MNDKRSYFVLFAVTAAHLVLLALFLATSGAVVPPVQLQTMQGLLISKASREPAEVSRQKEASRPGAKAPTPEPSRPPPAPVKLPPSERAVALPQPKPQPAPASAPSAPATPPASAPAKVQATAPTSESASAASAQAKDAQTAAAQAKQGHQAAQASPRSGPAVEQAARSGAGNSAEPLVLPRVDAGHLNNTVPSYPSVARRLGEQGQVLLDVLILPDGSVGEIKVKRSSGFQRLDNAALFAVKRWRYQSARRGSTPIAYWYVQPMVFSLAK